MTKEDMTEMLKGLREENKRLERQIASDGVVLKELSTIRDNYVGKVKALLEENEAQRIELHRLAKRLDAQVWALVLVQEHTRRCETALREYKKQYGDSLAVAG